jgi:hypothetical protein
MMVKICSSEGSRSAARLVSNVCKVSSMRANKDAERHVECSHQVSVGLIAMTGL